RNNKDRPNGPGCAASEKALERTSAKCVVAPQCEARPHPEVRAASTPRTRSTVHHGTPGDETVPGLQRIPHFARTALRPAYPPCPPQTPGAFLPSPPPPSAIARIRRSSRPPSSLLAFMLAPSPALRATCKQAQLRLLQLLRPACSLKQCLSI